MLRVTKCTETVDSNISISIYGDSVRCSIDVGRVSVHSRGGGAGVHSLGEHSYEIIGVIGVVGVAGVAGVWYGDVNINAVQ